METQEIPEPQKTQDPQKTQEPTEGSKTEGPKTEGPQKVKNPVRVAAGKKGAEARWSKRKHPQAQHAQQAQPEHEPIRITKESPEQPPPRPPVTVNVYKNFFPLCVLIGAAGIGIFLICRKAEMQPKIQPEIKQRPTDPFEMR